MTLAPIAAWAATPHIAAGGVHSATVNPDASLWSWGGNDSSQLGYDTLSDADTAIGHDLFSTISQQVGTATDWTEIALGKYHTVALKADGSLWAWGRNLEGQLGDGSGINKAVPTRIGTDNDWTAVAAGGFHTVALKADGTLWAWGQNVKGQLGDGTTQNRFTPLQVGTGITWLEIVAGNDFTLAIKDDRTLWGWGDNSFSQLGYDTAIDADPVYVTRSRIPQQVGVKNDWMEIAAGMYHVLALDASSDLWAWGHNDWGQLGNGTTVASSVPIQVTSGIPWRKIEAGNYFSLALKTDGTLWSWGANDWGQLGDGGGLGFFRPLPGQVGAATDWVDAAAGSAYSLALKIDGSFQGWGSNQNGQLGDSTLNDTVARTVAIDLVTTPTNISSQTIFGNVDQQTAQVSVTVTDVDGNVVSAGAAALEGTSWSYFVTGLAEGENVVIATATDAAAFDTAQAMSIIFFDQTPPSAPSVAAPTPTNNPVWTWTTGGGGSGTFRYKLDDSDFSSGATETAEVSFAPGGLLSEQIHTLYVQERDGAGNWSTSGFLSVLVDRTKPAAPQVSGPSATNDPTPSWSWTHDAVDGSGSFRCKLDDTDFSTGAIATTDTVFTPSADLSETTHILYVQELDLAGNWSDSGFFSIAVDITPPLLDIDPVVTPTNEPNQLVYGFVEKGATVQIATGSSASGGSAEVLEPVGRWFYEITGLETGENPVVVTATDAAGSRSAPVSANIYFDNTLPVVTILTPEMGKRYASPVLNYTLSDDYAAQAPTAVASVAGGGVVANGDVLTGLADGEHHLQVVATDAAGNEATTVVMFTVDTLPPVLTLNEVTSPNDSPSLVISGTAESGATVSIATDTAASDGEVEAVGGSWSYEITGLEVGDNHVTLIAMDAAGNESEPIPLTLTRAVTASQLIEDVGRLVVSGKPTSYYTTASHHNPVVIVGPPTSHDLEQGVIRLSNVSGSGFTVHLQEWDYLDQEHGKEDVAFMVFEEGRYAMPDGSVWEVGSFNLSGNKQYFERSFGKPFATDPTVFLTVQSSNETDAVSIRVRNVTAGTFEAALFEEEGESEGHAEEKIGYLAISSPQGSGVAQVGAAEFPYLLQQLSIGSTSMPVLSTSLALEEEQSADAETVHAAESVTVLALGPLLFAQVAGDNEADTVALRQRAPEDPAAVEWGALILSDNAWVTVPLAKVYGNPVVVTKPASISNAEPGYLQVRNVTGASFEVRYDEWAGTWEGTRREPVQVFYLVAETGEQSLGGLSVVAGKLENSAIRYPVWQDVVFASRFPVGPPAVFASAQTATGSPVVTRVQNCTDGGFELSMQGAEAEAGASGSETLGWIAIAKGAGVTADGRVLTVFGTSAGSPATSVSFSDYYPKSQIFSGLGDKFAARYQELANALSLQKYLLDFSYLNPVLVGDLNTTREADTATLGYRNMVPGGVELQVQEERTLDTEVDHAVEEIAVFVAE